MEATKDTLKERTAKIRQWFEDCDSRLPATKVALLRAASYIFQRQTAAEQSTESTNQNNGVGFNQADAGYFSWIVKEWVKGESIPDKVSVKMKFRLKKYSRQLAEIALSKEP